MYNIIKDFNYSRKSCDGVNLKLELDTVFANFCVCLLKESTSARQGLKKLVTKHS